MTTGTQPLPVGPENDGPLVRSLSPDPDGRIQWREQPQQFSIATLLLLITLIGVCLGLFRINPALGAASLLLIVPALLRTTLLARREKRFGGRLTAAEKVAVFLGSMAVVVVVMIMVAGVSTAVFFVGLVVAAAVAQLGEAVAVFAGIFVLVATLIAGVVTAWFMFRLTWPLRDEFVRQLHRGDLIQIPEKGRQGEGPA